jgi:hypothetical protein
MKDIEKNSTYSLQGCGCGLAILKIGKELPFYCDKDTPSFFNYVGYTNIK